MVYLKQNPYFVPFPSFYGMLDLVFRTSDCLSLSQRQFGNLTVPAPARPGRPAAGTVTLTQTHSTQGRNKCTQISCGITVDSHGRD